MFILPEIPARKKPRPAYRKSEAVKVLERLANDDAARRHPNMPRQYLAPRLYRDDSANGLTKCIVEFLNLSGHMAERINTTGRYIDKSKTFTDVMGRQRTIGTGQWLPTSGMKGSADISATIDGMSVKIEVKMNDRQSEDQKHYQQRVEAAGGIYLIIRSFAEFYDWYAVRTAPQKSSQCIDNQDRKIRVAP